MKVDVDIEINSNGNKTNNSSNNPDSGEKENKNKSREDWKASKEPNWSKVKTEKTPLLDEPNENITNNKKLILPHADKKNWIATDKMPENVPFIKLTIPFSSKMPTKLEYESEEVRDKIGNDNWNKLVSDAIIIGAANEQVDCCLQNNGILAYMCCPCFWFCFYKYRDDKLEDSLRKWKKTFDQQKIPFDVAYKPGDITEAFYSANFELSPKIFCFVIDIEKIYQESVAPKKNKKNKTVEKTPTGDCSCICIDTNSNAK